MLEILEQHINQRGNCAALVDFVEGSISWARLGLMVNTAINQIAQFDLSRPLIHDAPNDLNDVVIALAIASLGGIEAPLDSRLGPAERQRRVDILGGQVFELPPIESVPAEVSPTESESSGLRPSGDSIYASESRHYTHDVTFSSNGRTILWTSGTTSLPTGVVQRHTAWLANAAAKLAAVPQMPTDVRLTMLPLSHAYARTCDLGTWLLSGCTLAVTLGTKGLMTYGPSVNPTLINTVPSVARQLLHEDLDAVGLSRLRLLGVGGAALAPGDFDQWSKRRVTVIQGYGLTETGPVICSATPNNATAGLVGDFVEGWQTQIRSGELYVRGSHVMEGYYDASETTAKKIDTDGWLRTGDLVKRDEPSGQLRILGRVDDVIVLGNGIKVHPTSVEREVESLPGIDHALLLMRDQLELWIDGDEATLPDIEKLMQSLLSFCDVSIGFFEEPLSLAANELTSKLTVRRHQVIANRFGHST
ncbi:AMP-binding protein [Rubripirellula amarantea]|nr:AMP-binding protein [Rubripirellula amarantea]